MQTVNGFFDMLRQFVNGNSLYVIVGAAYLLFIYQLKKEYRHTAVIASVLLLLMIYNPISYKVLAEKMGFFKTYYRFLWIVPYVPLLAYMIYEAIRRAGSWKYRMAIVCVVCVGVIALNVDVENLKLPDNPYQIPAATIEVAEQLETLMEANDESSAMVLCDSNIANTLRQYDANICLPIMPYYIMGLDENLNENTLQGLVAMLMYNRNDIPEDVVEEILESYQVEYLVVNAANAVSLEYMRQIGWKTVSDTPMYDILMPGGKP